MTTQLQPSLRSVLSDDELTDCASVTFDHPDGEVCIEAANFSDGFYYNVCSLPDPREPSIRDILTRDVGPNPVADRLVERVDLPVVEREDVFVLFESDDGGRSARHEIREIAAVLGVATEDITDVSTKTVETVAEGTWFATAVRLAGMDDHYSIRGVPE